MRIPNQRGVQRCTRRGARSRLVRALLAVTSVMASPAACDCDGVVAPGTPGLVVKILVEGTTTYCVVTSAGPLPAGVGDRCGDEVPVDFESVYVTGRRYRELVIESAGTAALRFDDVDDVRLDLDADTPAETFEMVFDQSRFANLRSGAAEPLAVSFNPTAEGSFGATLLFTSNAGAAAVRLAGVGLRCGQCAPAPDPFCLGERSIPFTSIPGAGCPPDVPCEWRAVCEQEVDCAIPECQGGCNPTAGLCRGCEDADRDGASAIGPPNCPALDCDDHDPHARPGATEVCDGVDNDCDAGTPDGASEPTLGAPCDGSDADACPDGATACVDGALSCRDDVDDTMHAETCDSADNDCDGETDEAFPLLGHACDDDDADRCARGAYSCTADGEAVACVGDADQMEVCGNGTDDDCREDTSDVFDADCDGVPCTDDPDDRTRDRCGDDDGDSCDDCMEYVGMCEGCACANPRADGPDCDGDGLCDAGDPDDDNDGIADAADTDACDPCACADSDMDGCDDCSLCADGFDLVPGASPERDGPDCDGDGLCRAGDSEDGDCVCDGVSGYCLTTRLVTPGGAVSHGAYTLVSQLRVGSHTGASAGGYTLTGRVREPGGPAVREE